jgi:hypothetical protein
MKTRRLWWIAKIDPPLKPGQTWRSIKNWRDGSYSDDGEYLGKWSYLTDQELEYNQSDAERTAEAQQNYQKTIKSRSSCSTLTAATFLTLFPTESRVVGARSPSQEASKAAARH